jgi:peptidase MA superfamily protein
MSKHSILLILSVLVMGLSSFSIRQAHAEVPSGAGLKDKKAIQGLAYLKRYDDGGFDWQTLEAGALRISWYNGDANFGQTALDTAQSGLQSIGKLMPLDLAQPIEVFIYANADDLHGTLPPDGEDWVAGHADPVLGVVMVVVGPGADQSILMEQRIPHELMHVLLYRRLGAGYHNIPAWLREGLAALAEIYPNPDYDRVLADAGAHDKLIPLKDLCVSFPADAGEAFLAYAESRSFTSYLRDLYGSAGLMGLAGHYADGVDCEHGPERAFGVSLSRLELNWRESALGQKAVGFALRNMAPYLVLLCLVLFVPLMGVLSMIRRRGNGHGPETYAR